MQLWVNIFKGLILILVLAVLSFNVLLYRFCEQQKDKIDSMKDQLKLESQANSNEFKYQQDQIEHIKKDLEDAQDQIKEQKDALSDQKDALLQEIGKRQKIEDDNKSVMTSLMDIKAEADAIKQDMKGWQKDYVSVLAELEKKIDDSQQETKALETNLTALNIPELKENINSLKAEIEKMVPPPADNSATTTIPGPDEKTEHTQLETQ